MLTGMSDTTTERVRTRLRDEILDGQFPPGERLKINDMAARYGISPIPIREALRLLAGEGLIEMLPHRGALVRMVDAAFVCNMYDIRAALEAMLVRRTIAHIQPPDLSRVRHHQLAYAAGVAARDVRAILAANAAFHGTLSTLANNDEAVRMMERSWDLIRAMRIRFGFSPRRMAANVAEHQEIFDAVAARDAGRAARAITDHSSAGRDDLLTYLGGAPRTKLATRPPRRAVLQEVSGKAKARSTAANPKSRSAAPRVTLP